MAGANSLPGYGQGPDFPELSNVSENLTIRDWPLGNINGKHLKLTNLLKLAHFLRGLRGWCPLRQSHRNKQIDTLLNSPILGRLGAAVSGLTVFFCLASGADASLVGFQEIRNVAVPVIGKRHSNAAPSGSFYLPLAGRVLDFVIDGGVPSSFSDIVYSEIPGNTEALARAPASVNVFQASTILGKIACCLGYGVSYANSYDFAETLLHNVVEVAAGKAPDMGMDLLLDANISRNPAATMAMGMLAAFGIGLSGFGFARWRRKLHRNHWSTIRPN